MEKFMLIDRPSAYNAILEKTALNELREITLTPHLKMKFPSESCVWEGGLSVLQRDPGRHSRESRPQDEVQGRKIAITKWRVGWRIGRVVDRWLQQECEGRIRVTPRAKRGTGGFSPGQWWRVCLESWRYVEHRSLNNCPQAECGSRPPASKAKKKSSSRVWGESLATGGGCVWTSLILRRPVQKTPPAPDRCLGGLNFGP